MYDVFVSFARADAESASRVAEGLRVRGLSVWWDQAVSKGKPRAMEAPQIMRDARLVVCLWSRAFMRSFDRRTEASMARSAHKLVPLALKDFKWDDCAEEDLWSVGTAIPRLQFSDFFFAWLLRVLRRRLDAQNDQFTCDDLAAVETLATGPLIDFVSKDIEQVCRGRRGAPLNRELSQKIDAYFSRRQDILDDLEYYRGRVRKLYNYEAEEKVVPFPGLVATYQEANIGARKINLRIGGAKRRPDFAESVAPERAAETPKLPLVRVISQTEPPPQAAPEQSKGFSLSWVSQWLTAFAWLRKPEKARQAKVYRYDEKRFEAVLNSLKSAYVAQTIDDLDASIADGFAAVKVGYVGVGAMPVRELAQQLAHRRDNFSRARWLDVEACTALDREEASTYVQAGRLRVESAFMTQVPPLHASVCALSESGGGVWSDPTQAATIRLLSRFYVSFGSYLYHPMAAPEIELTPRQRECLQWAALGKSNRQIGEILDFDTEIVMDHLNAARRRLEVATQAQAVNEAIARGLIAPPFC